MRLVYDHRELPGVMTVRPDESASRPLVGFGVLNDNLIKCLISFVEVHEQILSNRYKSIHGYITRSTIMMQMELCDQCVIVNQ
jgi:hypothetical protein